MFIRETILLKIKFVNVSYDLRETEVSLPPSPLPSYREVLTVIKFATELCPLESFPCPPLLKTRFFSKAPFPIFYLTNFDNSPSLPRFDELSSKFHRDEKTANKIEFEKHDSAT